MSLAPDGLECFTHGVTGGSAILTLYAPTLATPCPRRLSRQNPGAPFVRVTVRTRLLHDDVVGALTTSRSSPTLAIRAPLAELHAHMRMHPQAELAVEAAQVPNWADPQERLDVLSLSARRTWCNGSAKGSDSVLSHERLQPEGFANSSPGGSASQSGNTACPNAATSLTRWGDIEHDIVYRSRLARSSV